MDSCVDTVELTCCGVGCCFKVAAEGVNVNFWCGSYTDVETMPCSVYTDKSLYFALAAAQLRCMQPTVESFWQTQCVWRNLQAPAKHQSTIAHVLGIPQHKVVCHVKRIGGGFGGKESRSVFSNAAAAVPAWLLRRPVRLILDRDEDMHWTGHRHAFLGKYKVSSALNSTTCYACGF